MKVCPQCGLNYPDTESRCFVDNATLERADDPFVGQTLAGRYLVEEAIGSGGMSTVYRARHTMVDRPVAVKIMSGSLAKDAGPRERFRREAKNAAALAHPNIIEIYDYGQTEDEAALFLVMELLQGAPLSQLIEQGTVPPPTVALLGLQIAQGLARAHDFDVIHRDLKPENVFVSDTGRGRVTVKLLDFGIARSMHDSRLTNQGELFGTPQYMAPERITSIDAGPSADLYALGVILFEMLTGQLPFHAEQLTGYFIHHLQTPPPRPSDLVPQCPRRMEELILALMAKSPEERPVDAHAVIKELRALLPEEGAPVAAPTPTPSAGIKAPTLPPTTVERWARRAVIFEEMLVVAHPGGAPAEFRQMLDAVRDALRQITQLRHDGLQHQRALEEHEGEARDNRARLGHAVQSLGEDLSLARESVRKARGEVQPYFDADAQAEEAYRSAHRALAEASGFGPYEQPNEQTARRLRDIADALDRWALARAAASKARRWVDAREKETGDIEFQVRALRGNLEKTEAEFATRREEAERVLVDFGKRAAEQEERLIQHARDFCDRLRSHQALQAHFQRLEQE